MTKVSGHVQTCRRCHDEFEVIINGTHEDYCENCRTVVAEENYWREVLDEDSEENV